MQQDPGMLFAEENANVKPHKKKTNKKMEVASPAVPLQENAVQGVQRSRGSPSKMGKRGTKRIARTGTPPVPHQPERSTSDSLPDFSASGDDYRALRRQYLLLEEEGFELGDELRELEAEVLMLEDEKHELLDELVVLEGLVDPLELRNQGLGRCRHRLQ